MRLASRQCFSHFLFWQDALVGVGVSILVPVLWSMGRSPMPLELMGLYILVSALMSVICISVGEVGGVAIQYFRIRDALRLVQVAAASVLMVSAIHFMINRGEGIGRALPAFHFLVLMLGLFGVRAIAFCWMKRDMRFLGAAHHLENVIVIGASLRAVAFISASQHMHHRRVLAVLDRNTNLHGRSIAGCPVMGKSASLPEIIAEYATHGVRVDKVFLAVDQDDLTPGEAEAIRIGAERFHCHALEHHEVLHMPRTPADESFYTSEDLPSVRDARARAVWGVKRLVDSTLALLGLVVLSPFFLCGTFLVLCDLGFPTLFWQERLGRDGRALKVLKFRTMSTGSSTATRLGSALRRSRIDELPQLLNVLRGEMSLVGPRPLLATEQRVMSRFRLAVRPGLTGWAQVCGANLCTLEEKFALDEWYVENASLMLDAKIFVLTARVVAFGEVRREQDIDLALAARAVRRARIASAKRQPVITLIHAAQSGKSIVGDAQPSLSVKQIAATSLQG
ncbi:MAG: hypothetical protein RJB09_405 [Pseudomonadota bacterium]